MFCKNTSGMPRWQHSSMKCAPLSADSLNRMPLFARMPTGLPFDVREAAHERRAVARLELREVRAVDDARDDLVHVVRLARVRRDDPVDLVRVARGRARLAHRPRVVRPAVEVVDDLAHDAERVLVVDGVVVGDAADARVHVRAAELFGRDDLAGGRLHERRTAQEDRALVFDDDRLVGHRGHVRAAGGARAHHRGDLRDPLRAHARLVVEDAPEMVAVGEHVGLQRQERTTRIDEVDAGEPILLRDLLRAQMFLYRDRIVRAAFDGRVVRDDHALRAVDRPDAGDHPGGGRVVMVHSVGSERGELEERRAGVDEPVDAVARGELAALAVPLDGDVATAAPHARELAAQLVDQCGHRCGIALVVGGAAVDAGREEAHARTF